MLVNMKKIRIQLLIIAIILAGTMIYRWTKPRQLNKLEHETVVEAAKTLSHFADLKKQNNNFHIRSIAEIADRRKENVFLSQVKENVVKIDSLTINILQSTNSLWDKAVKSVDGYTKSMRITKVDKKVEASKEEIKDWIHHIDKYLAQIAEISNMDSSSIYFDTKGNAVSKAEFANLYLMNKPLSILLSNLSRIKSDIIEAEEKAILRLGKNVSYFPMEFEELVPVVIPEKREIKEGEEYKATVAVYPKLSTQYPMIAFKDSKSISVEDGYAEVKIKAEKPYKKKDKQIYEKEWNASLTINGPYGNQTFTKKDKFLIEK